MRHKHLSLLALLLMVLGSVVTASGRVLNPCTPGFTKEENIIPVRNEGQVYCVSDFGFSDTWFAGPVMFYDQSLDILSGDSAHNFRFSIGGEVRSGTGWPSPGLGAGFLVPMYPTWSPYTVVMPVDYIDGDPTRAWSMIRHPVYGIDIGITTEVVGDTLTQTFYIMNNGPQVIESSRFAYYGNIHPNGSLPADVNKGTVTYFEYQGLPVLWTTGLRDSTWIADALVIGTIYGQPRDKAHGQLAGAHDVGRASPFPDGTIYRVENNIYNGLDTFGPGDAAGALAYDLPNLNPGEAVTVQLTMLIIRE